MNKKKLVIDARMWGTKHTGIGRYVENLIDNLPEKTGFYISLIIPPDLVSEPKLKQFPKIVSQYHPYSILSQIEIFLLLKKAKPDLVHFTHFSVNIFWNGPYILTLHDLILNFSTSTSTTTRNRLVYLIKRLGYLITLHRALNHSLKIIVPSNYWKTKLIEKYKINTDKITVTYEGVSALFFQTKYHKLSPLPKPYVVYTGNLYPHKNVPILVEAINNLRGQIKLGIVCARSVFTDRVPQSPFVHFLGRVSDEELINIYHHALAFIFPSKIEGFGLPGLEAMAVGIPVIAAASSCLPEIYGDAALYFNPTDSVDLTNKILLLLNSSAERKKLIVKGFSRVKRYSWKKMAEQTWEIYQKMLH